MANQQHVDILLREGIPGWNRWRKERPDIRPNLSGAHLVSADLVRADLSRADLRGALLVSASLNRADLSQADLFRAHMSQAELSEANLSQADLDHADLSQANLVRADLSGADLGKARLGHANLSGAHLRGTDLREADLFRADLREADFSGADLREAYFTQADLSRADFSGADLSGAHLTETKCLRTTFSGADLTGCDVYGMSACDLNLEGAQQADLRITPLDMETTITVDNLEVAQFLYFLLRNQQALTLLDTITSKVVLILGRFNTERKPVLNALREALRRHPNGYSPVLLDFDSQREQPDFETVKTLANLARFVIADLTEPNLVRSALTYITANLPTVPVQPIMASGATLPTEYATWKRHQTFLEIYRYADPQQLLANRADAVIAPVEAHVVARRLADVNGL